MRREEGAVQDPTGVQAGSGAEEAPEGERRQVYSAAYERATFAGRRPMTEDNHLRRESDGQDSLQHLMASLSQ